MGGDRIEVRGLRVLGVHGLLAEERERAQPFDLDFDLWLDLEPAGRTDDLRSTADYGALAAAAAEVVARRSFGLLETVASTVADVLLEQERRASRVSVTVRKVRPPLPLDVGSVGVRVDRRRNPGAGPGPC